MRRRSGTTKPGPRPERRKAPPQGGAFFVAPSMGSGRGGRRSAGTCRQGPARRHCQRSTRRRTIASPALRGPGIDAAGRRGAASSAFSAASLRCLLPKPGPAGRGGGGLEGRPAGCGPVPDPDASSDDAGGTTGGPSRGRAPLRTPGCGVGARLQEGGDGGAATWRASPHIAPGAVLQGRGEGRRTAARDRAGPEKGSGRRLPAGRPERRKAPPCGGAFVGCGGRI